MTTRPNHISQMHHARHTNILPAIIMLLGHTGRRRVAYHVMGQGGEKPRKPLTPKPRGTQTPKPLNPETPQPQTPNLGLGYGESD